MSEPAAGLCPPVIAYDNDTEFRRMQRRKSAVEEMLADYSVVRVGAPKDGLVVA